MEIIAIVVLCIFAVYGIIGIISAWTDIFTPCLKPENGKTYLVMTVKNCEDSIEGTVRSVAWKMLSKTNGLTSDLVVVDTGSQDNTLKILSKLEEEYDFIHTMTKESYIDMLHKQS